MAVFRVISQVESSTWISAVVELLTSFAANFSRFIAGVWTLCWTPISSVSIFTVNLAALQTITSIATRVSKGSFIAVWLFCLRPAEIRIFIAICTSYEEPTLRFRYLNQSNNIYIAPLLDTYLETLPRETPAKRKRTVLKRWWNWEIICFTHLCKR